MAIELERSVKRRRLEGGDPTLSDLPRSSLAGCPQSLSSTSDLTFTNAHSFTRHPSDDLLSVVPNNDFTHIERPVDENAKPRSNGLEQAVFQPRKASHKDPWPSFVGKEETFVPEAQKQDRVTPVKVEDDHSFREDREICFGMVHL